MISILDSLKFVQAGVGKKDIVAGLSHFRITNNRVTSNNGVITLSSPIDIGIDCSPKAETMLKAIASCNDQVILKLTPTGRLSVKSGAFSVNIECIDSFEPEQPEGELVAIDGKLYVDAFKAVLPFVGTDAFAHRAFCTGVLLKDCSLYATNNVVFAQHWIGQQLTNNITIPSQAIRELIRIKDYPTHIQMTDKNITFHFENGRWLKCVLIDAEWPDVSRVLNNEIVEIPIIDDSLFEAIESIRPFCDKKVPKIIIENGTVRTHSDINEGANYHIVDHKVAGVFQPDMLLTLKGVATHADFSDWTKPCAWQGGMLRGVIIGMRL